MRTRHLAPLLALGVATLLATSAVAADSITVKGSDTMILIAQRWAEVYMKGNPGTSIQVTGGGSGTGIAAIIDGTCTLADASRPIKQSELAKGQEKGKTIVEHKVALDALCIVVNASNTVPALSLPQVKAIFTGAVSNWSQVGGPDLPILLYSRESNSGTYTFLKEEVLNNADYSASAQTLPGTAAIANAVAKDGGAVGYGGAAYFAKKTGVRIVPIKRTKDDAAVSPIKNGLVDEEAVRSMTYPISRYLYCYTSGEPAGALKAYLDWILSPAGQKLVQDLEYVPLKPL
ncbi:MAG: PstS family phosphate ABC transporter substrate-binding protein [bacterium]